MRRAVCAAGTILSALACPLLLATLLDADWLRLPDGQGRFGLYRYRSAPPAAWSASWGRGGRLELANLTRAGRINGNGPSALCSLRAYNASRPARHRPADRDDCDAMVDACGLGRTMGVLGVVVAAVGVPVGVRSSCADDARVRWTAQSAADWGGLQDGAPAARGYTRWPRYSSAAAGGCTVS